MSCIFSGLVVGGEIPRYLESLQTTFRETPDTPYANALKIEQDFKSDLMSRQGPENVHALHDELSDWMVRNVTVKRNNQDLERTFAKIKEIRERYKRISLDDHSQFANQTYIFANQFAAMLEVSLVITKGALLRNESRGAHFKPEFALRDDSQWLKTTIAKYTLDEPTISYEPVDSRYLKPQQRDYSSMTKTTPVFENLPEKIPLPL